MADLLALKDSLEAMTPADRLRLAAGLIEQAKNAATIRLAETIAENVVQEMQVARLFAKKS